MPDNDLKNCSDPCQGCQYAAISLLLTLLLL